MSKKKRSSGRKTKKRSDRLQSAKHWVLTYEGTNIIKAYKKKYAVDVICAIYELKMLNVKLDASYTAPLIQSHEQLIRARQRKKEEKKQLTEEITLFDSDDHFYFIAGYTSGGFPYGTTWEEAIAEGHVDGAF